MRILQITNWHRNGGGSDYMAQATTDLLRNEGHDVTLLSHDSREFEGTLQGKLKAALSGVYSPAALDELRSILKNSPPDVVHVHELYPYHSPWVLRALAKAGIPVVMTCHDFRVTCPVATHLYKNAQCTRCAGGNTAWCLLKNCRANHAESAAFALRSGVANVFGLYSRYVTRFIAPSEFVRNVIVQQKGIPEDRFRIVPNLIRPVKPESREEGSYVAFAGRITPEKGIDTLLKAAATCQIPIHIAGGPVPAHLRAQSPGTVTWLGHIEGVELAAFYRKARFLVVPSYFEPFGLVVGEAMLHGLPVLGAGSGALPELIRPGIDGMLFTAGDAQDLAQKLTTLWENPALCRSFSKAAEHSARQKYCHKIHYAQLVAVYTEAISAREQQSARQLKNRTQGAEAKS